MSIKYIHTYIMLENQPFVGHLKITIKYIQLHYNGKPFLVRRMQMTIKYIYICFPYLEVVYSTCN